MKDTYAVFGNPISHSLSPFIHQEFAKQTNQEIDYLKIEVPPDQFTEHVQAFKKAHGKGLNITAPFKQQAFELATIHTDRAKQARAVNTIKFLSNGEILGDNTDGIGFIRDLLEHHHVYLKDQKILLLGAGGAARGILSYLLEQQPQLLTIANRTLQKAIELADEFHSFGNITSTSFEALTNGFDLLINATSTWLSQVQFSLASIISSSLFCYDLKYGKETQFLNWAKAHGSIKMADGIGMLVEQAAESFFLWRGVRPQTIPVIKLCKKKLHYS
jgi:shikimate dehydrogenase